MKKHDDRNNNVSDNNSNLHKKKENKNELSNL